MSERPIQLPPSSEFSSVEIGDELDRIRHSVTKLISDRTAVADEIESIRASPATAASFTKLEQLRTNRVLLLQLELDLREELARWIVRYEADMRTKHSLALAAITAAELSIEKKLEALGYAPMTFLERPDRILPLFIHCHPEVRNARARAMAIQGAQSVGPSYRELNDRAVKAAKEEMNKWRNALLVA